MRLIEPEPVWIPSVSQSFMQGLVHNLSIRWMDVWGHVAEGGTEYAGGDE